MSFFFLRNFWLQNLWVNFKVISKTMLLLKSKLLQKIFKPIVLRRMLCTYNQNLHCTEGFAYNVVHFGLLCISLYYFVWFVYILHISFDLPAVSARKTSRAEKENVEKFCKAALSSMKAKDDKKRWKSWTKQSKLKNLTKKFAAEGKNSPIDLTFA